MKTKIMIPAMFACALAFSPFVANSTVSNFNNSEMVEDEKTQLDIQELPEVLKNAIAIDETAAVLTINEAWHIKKDDGTVYYKVKFDHNGEELVRKYDSEGNIIKDDQI
ncbi:hypothetical protein [Aquiflexum sp.]|uniref:hypothetical protein n=1 Tax=Aquiflexum sp. TaxID=1872584 RepID=UPI0035938DCF